MEDAVSLSIIWISITPVVLYLTSSDTYYLKVYAGVFFVAAITHVLKYAFGTGGWRSRPNGARGCDIFCGDHDHTGLPGFPSGHMAVATFLTVALAQGPWASIVGGLWITAMAWSRWAKKCHTIPQIIAGAALGGTLGAILH
jgi:membrane-associated phospholipid phosphatase